MQVHRPIYRITALLLAFLLLFSSIGIAIDVHYCQGNFKSLSVLGKAKSCHEIAQQQAACPHHQAQQQKACSMTSEKDCCDSKMFYFQADQDQQIASADLLLTKANQQFLIAAYYFLFADYYRSADRRGPVPDYHSPMITRDISVLFETYLL